MAAFVLLYTLFFSWKEQFYKNNEFEILQREEQLKNKLRLRLYQVWFIFQDVNKLIW